MKLSKTILLLLLILFAASATTPNDLKDEKKVVLSGTGIRPHLMDEMPSAYYSPVTQTLTIAFPATDFEPYTLSVASAYTTQDYYVTTPSVTVAVYDTDLTIDLQIETEGGDVYWGSFVATAATSTE